MLYELWVIAILHNCLDASYKSFYTFFYELYESKYSIAKKFVDINKFSWIKENSADIMKEKIIAEKLKWLLIHSCFECTFLYYEFMSSPHPVINSLYSGLLINNGYE